MVQVQRYQPPIHRSTLKSHAISVVSANCTIHESRAVCPQQQTPFFRLPPELRNRIYEMTFYCDSDSINLTTAFPNTCYFGTSSELGPAAPPSTALLRSCQRVNLEAKGIYDAATQAYWKKEFTIIIYDSFIWSLEERKCIWNIPDRFFVRVRRFTLTFFYQSYKFVTSFVLTSHGWMIETSVDLPGFDDDHNATRKILVETFLSTMFRFQSFKGYPGLSPEPLKSQIIMNMLGPLCYEQRI